MDYIYPPHTPGGTREELETEALPGSLNVIENGYGLIYTNEVGGQKILATTPPMDEPTLAQFDTELDPEGLFVPDESHGALAIFAANQDTNHYAGLFRTVPAGGAEYLFRFTAQPGLTSGTNASIAISNGDLDDFYTFGPALTTASATFSVWLEWCHITVDGGGTYTRTVSLTYHLGAFIPLWIKIVVDAGGGSVWHIGRDPYHMSVMDALLPANLTGIMVGFGNWRTSSAFEQGIVLDNFTETLP
jgi:hypothetical protein